MEGRGRSRRRRGDGCRTVECSTPRRIVARWLFGLGSARRRRAEEEDVGEDDVAPTGCSTKCLNEDIPLESAGATSRYESPRSEASFSMGLSFLLYLVVASKSELEKMAELRKQMGLLLQNAKEQQQRKELQDKPPKLSNHTKDHSEGLDPNEHQFFPQVISNLALSIFEESSTSVLQDEHADTEVSKPEECHGGTDRESKLKPEIRSLRQDRTASEEQRKHQKQEKIKHFESTGSHMLISEEVTDERYGVCPYELERKLHELLKTRQQEQIQELETALRRVERRLQEKETEVSWWKDAASLLSRRVPESARTGLECNDPESCRTRKEYSVSRSSRTGLKCRASFSR